MTKAITSAASLETTAEARRAGFLEIALRKNKEALPYIDEAKALKASASTHKHPKDLLHDPIVREALPDAAGLSTKARAHIDSASIDEIVKEFIAQFLEPAGASFVDELVYRYLLSKGDALGGRMRNIAGELAQERFTRSLVATLTLAHVEFQIAIRDRDKWSDPGDLTGDELGLVKALRWKLKTGELREAIYNIKVPIVNKNIDFSVFRGHTPAAATSVKTFRRNPNNYLALGELKGGIDPAGADEHWKTARTSLQRIRDAFKAQKAPISTFFVGSAIETAMAQEIFEYLESGILDSAANLTKDDQVNKLCAWILKL